MSKTSLRVSSAIPLRVTSGIVPLRPRKWRFVLLLGCLMFLSVGGTAAGARPRRPPLKFKIKVVDSATLKPRSKFFLGERASLIYTLTNQSNVARVVTQLPDSYIPFKLNYVYEYEEPNSLEGSFSGTAGSFYRDGITYWTERPPRQMTIAPGQTVSVTVPDLGRAFGPQLQEGKYTLTATYNSSLKAAVSFRVVIDEARSTPLLEQLAAAPVTNGDEGPRNWANIYLQLIRQPSIIGRVVDSNGKPLKDVWIHVSGSENTNVETRSDGRYQLARLTKGGTYTLTPEIRTYGRTGNTTYKIEPASRTIANLNAKVTEVNFTVTRMRTRAEVNVALEDEGAKARASSILSESDFTVESVIDDYRDAKFWGQGNDGWSDGTPNAFPDWFEVNLGSTKKIDLINVFTLRDNHGHYHADPDLKETFSKYGITDFDVQYWTGSVWKNVPGGTIRGNRNVWRKVEFPTIATSRIRVVIRNALAGHSRIVEIEAVHINDLPQAKIFTRGKAEINSSVQFRTEASDRDGTISYYSLDFGDNSPDYEWDPDNLNAGNGPKLAHQHTYDEPGIYSVTLRVIDNHDEASEAVTTVTITDPPKFPAATPRRP